MSKIERIADYKIKLHTKIYDQFIINDIMCNIIENFTSRHIGIMCDNIENNIIGFSVCTTDEYIIRETVNDAYNKFFNIIPRLSQDDWSLPNDATTEDLYNLTILNNNIDRSNVLLVL